MRTATSIPETCLQTLREDVRAIEARGASNGRRLPFGIDAVDSRLAGNGLSVTALHEVTGATTSFNDDAAATLFTVGIAARQAVGAGTVLWVLTRRDLFAPALARAGLSPGQVIYADCKCDDEALAVMEEGVRHCGLAAVVGEIGRATLTATRRLQLAAETSGTIALMLRRWRRSGQDPIDSPSVATTRWRIGSIPSQPLPVQGIARPRWKVELVRQRGGPPHEWILEGTDEAGCLALPAEPSHRSIAKDRRERTARFAA